MKDTPIEIILRSQAENADEYGADVAAHWLRKAATEIERLKQERIKLDRRIHNQRVSLQKNWMIIEMRAQYARAWYRSRLMMRLLQRAVMRAHD